MNYLETQHYLARKNEVECAESVDACKSGMDTVVHCLYTAYLLDNITAGQYEDETGAIWMKGEHRIQELLSLMEDAEDDD